MRAVVQRVKSASVSVDGEIINQIGKGFMVLLGIETGDSNKDLSYICDKVTGLRVFEDENDKMNLSVKDISGEILLISQFTLLGDARNGKRPSFIAAARPEEATGLYEKALCEMNKSVPTKGGVFGAHMEVELINDGPVTIMLESRRLF